MRPLRVTVWLWASGRKLGSSGCRERDAIDEDAAAAVGLVASWCGKRHRGRYAARILHIDVELARGSAAAADLDLAAEILLERNDFRKRRARAKDVPLRSIHSILITADDVAVRVPS